MKKQGHFVKGLGLFDTTNLVIGVMIGSGIFIVSADAARQVGSPALLLLVWAVVGLMTIASCLIYGELACMYPHAGGQYIYLKEAFHPLMGFLYGWTLFTVIQTGSVAAVGIAFAKFSGIIFPFISQQNIIADLGIVKVSTEQATAIVVILFLTFTNCHSLKVGKHIQNVFTVIKVFALISIIFVGLLFAKNHGLANITSWWTAQNGAPSGFSIWWLFAIALVGPLFAADAWNNVTFAGDEVKSAHINLPRALAIGSAVVIFLYILVNLAYLNVLPMDGIQHAPEDRVATAAISAVLGTRGAWVVAIAIMISTFGCLNGMILSGARLYWAMAQDKLFFKAAGQLGEKSGVPQAGLILQGIWAVALTLSGTYGDLLDYVIFASVLSYLLTVVGVFILRKKEPEIPRPYKTPWYPYLPALYILVSGTFLLALLWKKPMYTWPGLGIVLSGVPVYYLWRWITNSRLQEAA
ncbi:MAG: amino acid permease [Pseudomonadota bacterium]